MDGRESTRSSGKSRVACEVGDWSRIDEPLLRDALKALKENTASDQHLLFLYLCGREFDRYEELYQKLRETLTCSSYQKYAVRMFPFMLILQIWLEAL